MTEKTGQTGDAGRGGSDRSAGWVALVGAGPGDAGLITVRGLDRLRAADVVVYDALANPALLAEARDGAELIDAGKRAKAHRLTQDETNALLAEKALAGRGVCRLKGGDPYLFGRGAEEAMYLAERGVAVEVVCGVTSGVAAPAAAGVPVTLRGVSSTVTLVTGHEDPTKGASSVDYAALGTLIEAGGTACIYMGVGRLGSIASTLLDAGVASDMPVSVTQWGTTARQRSVRGILSTILLDVEREGIGAPAIVVIGRVAGPIDPHPAEVVPPGLDWFVNRPLFGQTVLVMRTRQQASRLSRRLAELGAEVIEAPTIETVPPADASAVEAAVAAIDSFDWVVLTSATGVSALADRLTAAGKDARALGGVRVAAVGEATAEALRERLAIAADLLPPDANGEALAEAMLAAGVSAGDRCLLLRADIARPALPRLLTEAGVDVTEAVAYETRPIETLEPAAVEALRDGRVDWAAFTSGSTARNLAVLLGDDGTAWMRRVRVASIGPVTSEAVASCGWGVAVEAAEASVGSLAEAIAAAVGRD
ncbi:MAG: uroporphyrinogen-III C-methyltransferase [Planctomycetota bacterium]